MRHEGIPYLDKNKDVADSIGHATSMMDEFEKFTDKADVNFFFIYMISLLSFFFVVVVIFLSCSIEIVSRGVFRTQPKIYDGAFLPK